MMDNSKTGQNEHAQIISCISGSLLRPEMKSFLLKGEEKSI